MGATAGAQVRSVPCRCIGLIGVGGALMHAIPYLDRSADLQQSSAEGLLHAALRAGDPHPVRTQWLLLVLPAIIASCEDSPLRRPRP